MAMKESVRSLRAYFIIIGLYAGLKDAIILIQSQGNIIVVMITLLGIGLGIAYLSIGIALQKLLVRSPNIITMVILVSMGILVVAFLLSLFGGVQVAMVAQLVIGLLITWYLFKNVTRLSAEEQGKRNV